MVVFPKAKRLPSANVPFPWFCTERGRQTQDNAGQTRHTESNDQASKIGRKASLSRLHSPSLASMVTQAPFPGGGEQKQVRTRTETTV